MEKENQLRAMFDRDFTQPKLETICDKATTWQDLFHVLDVDGEGIKTKDIRQGQPLHVNMPLTVSSSCDLNAEQLEERKVIVKTVHELYEYIDEVQIEEVFEKAKWQTTLALNGMEEKNVDSFHQRMTTKFPSVQSEYVHFIVGQLYPNEAKVVAALLQIDDLFAQLSLLQKSFENAQRRQREAIQRKQEALNERERANRNRAEKEKELAMLQGEDRIFMEGALDMLRQTESEYYETRLARANSEITACDRHLDELKLRLDEKQRAKFEITNPTWVQIQTAKMVAV